MQDRISFVSFFANAHSRGARDVDLLLSARLHIDRMSVLLYMRVVLSFAIEKPLDICICKITPKKTYREEAHDLDTGDLIYCFACFFQNASNLSLENRNLFRCCY